MTKYLRAQNNDVIHLWNLVPAAVKWSNQSLLSGKPYRPSRLGLPGWALLLIVMMYLVISQLSNVMGRHQTYTTEPLAIWSSMVAF